MKMAEVDENGWGQKLIWAQRSIRGKKKCNKKGEFME